jgi:hypothetical protein
MAVDVDDPVHPKDSDVADPASQGAGELRAVKGKVNSLFLNTAVGATQAHLIDVAKGINSVLTSAVVADLFGGASIFTRTASAAGKNTYGYLIRGVLNNGVTCANLNGLNVEARTGTGCTVTAAYAMGVLLTQQSVALNATLAGLAIVFANRLTAGAASPSGLGANSYNRNAAAILIDSFARSSDGEYCGWKTGMLFTANAIDRDVTDNKSSCINTQSITYLGGTDPDTAYPVRRILAMRENQAICFDLNWFSAFYVDSGTGRLTFSWGGNKRWEMDVNNGQVYKNGVLQY